MTDDLAIWIAEPEMLLAEGRRARSNPCHEIVCSGIPIDDVFRRADLVFDTRNFGRWSARPDGWVSDVQDGDANAAEATHRHSKATRLNRRAISRAKLHRPDRKKSPRRAGRVRCCAPGARSPGIARRSASRETDDACCQDVHLHETGPFVTSSGAPPFALSERRFRSAAPKAAAGTRFPHSPAPVSLMKTAVTFPSLSSSTPVTTTA